MTQSTDMGSPAARFSEAVRAFAPVCASRYAKLLPFKDGIAELRQKGASYRLIRELLATADVPVAVDTIGHFVREVIEQRPPPRASTRRKSVRTLSEPLKAGQVPIPVERRFPFTVAPPVEPHDPERPAPARVKAHADSPPVENRRARGPRIADPANL